MADIEPDELGEALARIEDSRTEGGSAGDTHALVIGVRLRGDGQGRGGGDRGGHGGRGDGGRGKLDGRGHQHHQQQWASHTPAQQQQQQPWKQQQQRPSGQHPGEWGPSRVCLRCGQPGHFYAEYRAIPPVPLNKYPPAHSYTASQSNPHANYSTNSPGNYASSSGGYYGQQMPAPPAPDGPPVPSDSCYNSSTDRAGMTQFFPPGEFASWNGILYNISTRRVQASVPRPFTSNFLPSAFAAQSKDNISDVWTGDSGASCHMANGATKLYCVRPPPPQTNGKLLRAMVPDSEWTMSGTLMWCHGKSEEPITLCDVSYVPALRFNIFSFHEAQQSHVIILDAVGAHIVGENITFPCEKNESYL